MKAHLSLETTEPTPVGSGFISGLLSAILGIAGFGAVLCFRFPEYLTHASLRPLYSLEYLRAIIHVPRVVVARTATRTCHSWLGLAPRQQQLGIAVSVENVG